MVTLVYSLIKVDHFWPVWLLGWGGGLGEFRRRKWTLPNRVPLPYWNTKVCVKICFHSWLPWLILWCEGLDLKAVDEDKLLIMLRNTIKTVYNDHPWTPNLWPLLTILPLNLVNFKLLSHNFLLVTTLEYTTQFLYLYVVQINIKKKLGTIAGIFLSKIFY